MSQELQQNRYDRLIRRVGGLIGVGSKVSEVIGELFPMIDVENLPGELFLLAETRLGMGATNNAAFAGLNNQSQIFNPVDSGSLITVSRVDIASASNQQIVFGLVTALLSGTNMTRNFRDGRLPIGPDTVAEIRSDQLAGANPNICRVRLQVNDNLTITDRNDIAVLAPGTGLQFSTTTVNTTLSVNYFWRERAAESSELQF